MKHHSLKLLVLSSLLLSACGSSPQSYLPAKTEPITNIESTLVEQLKVTTKPTLLELQNLTDKELNIEYKLFWYDILGVTQTNTGNQPSPWYRLRLGPSQESAIPLDRPTAESTNYRIYLRGKP